MRTHASLASMYGLNVPEERNGSGGGNTTNNTINMSESDFLRHLCNIRGVKLADG